ncbi:MAG: hypothetical protein L0Z53_15205 [Acidobacteriales bacterium]|nr:hypothetical protein [Terriglobales bacterium]
MPERFFRVRKRSFCVGAAVLILGSLALAQTQSASLPKASANELPAETTVITIQYHCPKQKAGTNTCSAKVPKAQFDAMVQALDPNMTAQNRQSLAFEYSRLLIMAAEARRRNIDKSPEVQTLLAFSTLQLLATRLVHDITAKTASVSPVEVDQYLRDHSREYDELKLSRIVIPLQTQQGSPPAEEQAYALYKRALAGENFDALQREVDRVSAEPHTALAPLACRMLPEAHRQVCGLNPGQVSAPVSDTLGYYIYRMESRTSPAVDKLRAEIRATLERQHTEQALHQVRTPVALELDERYFGELPSPELAAQHGLHYPAVTLTSPSKQSKKQHQH